MARQTALEVFEASPEAKVYVLEPEKARRLGGRTMLMPSGTQVLAAIQAIPAGETRTVIQIRKQLAAESGAEITCPVALSRLWRSIAELDYGPWWRVTVNGKPNPIMPGGITAHREHIVNEQAHGSSI